MTAGEPASSKVSAGSLVAGKFLLQKPLGQGGMGAVWLAQHTALRMPCALKFLHPSMVTSDDVRARFEREAVAAAQLRSPHVVQLLDHGVWEGAPYIAMELLEGEDLAQRLRRERRLSPRDTAAIVGQVSRALTRAHAVGLVHRDLKPANIFLVRDDDRDLAKVLDFGVAKIDSGLEVDTTTRTGALLGTPYYMSPEQAQGVKNLDHRSDLWALAVLTFQCLTGHLPFRSDALGELFMRIMVRPLPIPSQVAPVPFGFDTWWLRAATREPAGRFQTAREFAEALNLALGVTVMDASELSVRTPASLVPPEPIVVQEAVTLHSVKTGGSAGGYTPVPPSHDGRYAPTRNEGGYSPGPPSHGGSYAPIPPGHDVGYTPRPQSYGGAAPIAPISATPPPSGMPASLAGAVSSASPPTRSSSRAGLFATLGVAAVSLIGVLVFLAVRPSPGPAGTTDTTSLGAEATPSVGATAAPAISAAPPVATVSVAADVAPTVGAAAATPPASAAAAPPPSAATPVKRAAPPHRAGAAPSPKSLFEGRN